MGTLKTADGSGCCTSGVCVFPASHPCACVQDRDTVLRCREVKTNDQLDGITTGVVRFLETTQRVRVLAITVEYVINSANVVR